MAEIRKGLPNNLSDGEPPKDPQRSLFAQKFQQSLTRGLGLLKQDTWGTSDALSDLAFHQARLGDFDTAFQTLSHPQNTPYMAARIGQKVALMEREKGNKDNAVKVLDLASEAAHRIQSDRDYGGESEYFDIAAQFARVGEVQKALALTEEITGYGRENALFVVANSFARSGYDSEAFQAVGRRTEKRGSLEAGAIAQQQAERGDVEAWERTVGERIEDPSGLPYAYQGLAHHYFNEGDMQNARNALLTANATITEGELKNVADLWQSRFVDFALEKLHDSDTALEIAHSMKPNESRIQSYSDIVDYLQKIGAEDFLGKIADMAEQVAQNIPADDNRKRGSRKSLAPLIVADMFMRIGQYDNGKKKAQDALSDVNSADRSELARDLAERNCAYAAIFLATGIDNRYINLGIYGRVIDSSIKAGNMQRARQVLMNSTGLAQMAEYYSRGDQATEEDTDLLVSHLTAVGKYQAQLGNPASARRFFELAHRRLIQTKDRENKASYDSQLAQLCSDQEKAGLFQEASLTTTEMHDPMNRFTNLVRIAQGLINAQHYEEAYQTTQLAEELAPNIDPTKYYMGGPKGEQYLQLAGIYYQLSKLSS